MWFQDRQTVERPVLLSIFNLKAFQLHPFWSDFRTDRQWRDLSFCLSIYNLREFQGNFIHFYLISGQTDSGGTCPSVCPCCRTVRSPSGNCRRTLPASGTNWRRRRSIAASVQSSVNHGASPNPLPRYDVSTCEYFCTIISKSCTFAKLTAKVWCWFVQSFSIFSYILSLFIILIKPLTTKAHTSCASGDSGTSGV